MMEKGAFGNKKKNANSDNVESVKPAKAEKPVKPVKEKKEKPVKEKKPLFGGNKNNPPPTDELAFPPADNYEQAEAYPRMPVFGGNEEPNNQSTLPGMQNSQPTLPGMQSNIPTLPGMQNNAPPLPGMQNNAPPLPGMQNNQPPLPGLGSNQPSTLPGMQNGPSQLSSMGNNQPSTLPGLGNNQPSTLPGLGNNQSPLQGLGNNQAPLPQMPNNQPPLPQMSNSQVPPLPGLGNNQPPLPQMPNNQAPALPGMPNNQASTLPGMPNNQVPLPGMPSNQGPVLPPMVNSLQPEGSAPVGFEQAQLRVSPEIDAEKLHSKMHPPAIPGIVSEIKREIPPVVPVAQVPPVVPVAPSIPVVPSPEEKVKKDLEKLPYPKPPVPPSNTGMEGISQVSIQTAEIPSALTVSEMLAAKSFDVNIVSDMLNKEQLARTLLTENTVYQDAYKAMETLELEVKSVYMNKELTTSIKIQQIKDLLFKKMSHRDVANNILVQKFLDLCNSVVYQMERAAEERIDYITNTMTKTHVSSDILLDSVKLSESIQKRTELRHEAHMLLSALKNVYEIIHDESAKVTEELLKNVPSEHSYINQIFSSTGRAFLPPNTHCIATAILNDLQRDAQKFKAVELKLQKLMDVIYQFGIEDEKSLKESDRALAILQNNVVEKLVVPKTILQARLRVFIGCSNVGSTATMVTVAGRYSRRGNTLSINFSEKRKLERYGINPISAQEFIDKNPRKENMFVQEHLTSGSAFDRFRLIMNKVSERLGFYTHVNVFFDETQMDLVKELDGDILSFTMITNTSAESMETICKINKEFSPDNTAKRMVIIDAVEDMVSILEQLGVDLMTVKVITIPHSTAMRQYALLRKPPYLDPDIGQLFDAAFIE